MKCFMKIVAMISLLGTCQVGLAMDEKEPKNLQQSTKTDFAHLHEGLQRIIKKLEERIKKEDLVTEPSSSFFHCLSDMDCKLSHDQEPVRYVVPMLKPFNPTPKLRETLEAIERRCDQILAESKAAQH